MVRLKNRIEQQKLKQVLTEGNPDTDCGTATGFNRETDFEGPEC